jgi:hypothetical protein
VAVAVAVNAAVVGMHASALLYNIIMGIPLLYNNGYPIIMGHNICLILGLILSVLTVV